MRTLYVEQSIRRDGVECQDGSEGKLAGVVNSAESRTGLLRTSSQFTILTVTSGISSHGREISMIRWSGELVGHHFALACSSRRPAVSLCRSSKYSRYSGYSRSFLTCSTRGLILCIIILMDPLSRSSTGSKSLSGGFLDAHRYKSVPNLLLILPIVRERIPQDVLP